MRYESPLGSNKFQAKQLREFDVPDESEHEYEVHNHYPAPPMQQMQEDSTARVEREIREAREAKRTGKERLNEGAKRRLEILLGMTRTTHSVDIDGTVFVFQSLKAKEMRESIMCASEFDGTVQSPFEIRKQFLARSLTSIADVEFSQFIGSDTLEAKLAFIEELDDALLNRLYNEYLLMVNEAKDKYAIKSTEDVKGIVEDLKK